MSGAITVGASLFAWIQTGAWRYLVLAVGLACMSFAARHFPLQLKSPPWPPPEGGPGGSRAETFVQCLGWGLVIVALVAHWLG